jgi:hypothetical protein
MENIWIKLRERMSEALPHETALEILITYHTFLEIPSEYNTKLQKQA